MRLEIIQPDDWHVHVREGEVLQYTIPEIGLHFARAVIMPNTNSPIASIDAMLAYREAIHAAMGQISFEPLMTLYLTADFEPGILKFAKEFPWFHGVKLYPKGATTGAEQGVLNWLDHAEVFEQMALLNIPLMVHAEVLSPDVDVFDREAVCLEENLQPLIEAYPTLRVVLEHVSTQEGVNWVKAHYPQVAATVTAHHLCFDRNALLNTRIHPDLFCLPVLKRREHQQALVAAVTSGHPGFFLGTDSAPQAARDTYCASGCAGIYTQPYALSLYTQVFFEQQALAHLEGFTSLNGAQFYGRLPNTQRVCLVQKPMNVPEFLPWALEDRLTPICAGQRLAWQVEVV